MNSTPWSTRAVDIWARGAPMIATARGQAREVRRPRRRRRDDRRRHLLGDADGKRVNSSATRSRTDSACVLMRERGHQGRDRHGPRIRERSTSRARNCKSTPSRRTRRARKLSGPHKDARDSSASILAERRSSATIFPTSACCAWWGCPVAVANAPHEVNGGRERPSDRARRSRRGARICRTAAHGARRMGHGGRTDT